MTVESFLAWLRRIPSSRLGADAVAAKRALRRVRSSCDGWARTRLCLWLIDGLPLESMDLGLATGSAISPWDCALSLFGRVEQVVYDVRGCEPGDHQAVDVYRRYVSFAYYRVKAGSEQTPLVPAPGSMWREEQLQALRVLGLQHGELVRRLQILKSFDHG